MARTPSSMTLPLGAKAPEFSLPDTQARIVSRADYTGRVLVVMFICNHCPYVQHLRPALSQFARDYQPQGVGIVAINANDTRAYPQDNAEAMAAEVQRFDYRFAYLLDETQAVAKAYFAACTPDFFVFDNQHKLVYRGQFDDARPGNLAQPDGKSLREAVDAALAHRMPIAAQKPSLGCNIKWKPAAPVGEPCV